MLFMMRELSAQIRSGTRENVRRYFCFSIWELAVRLLLIMGDLQLNPQASSPPQNAKNMPCSVAWIKFCVGCCLDIEDHHVWAAALVPVSFRCCWRVGNRNGGWIETNCMTNLWSLSLFVHLSINRYVSSQQMCRLWADLIYQYLYVVWLVHQDSVLCIVVAQQCL